MIPTSDSWGPFAANITPGERVARCRALAAISHLCCGPRGAELVALLRSAETDSGDLVEALAILNRLAPLDRRRILATYAVLAAPARPARRADRFKGDNIHLERSRPSRRPSNTEGRT